MLSLLQETISESLKKRPSGNITYLTSDKELRTAIATLAVHLAGEAKSNGACWVLPNGEQVHVRSISDDPESVPKQERGVVFFCNGGLTPTAAELDQITAWRK